MGSFIRSSKRSTKNKSTFRRKGKRNPKLNWAEIAASLRPQKDQGSSCKPHDARKSPWFVCMSSQIINCQSLFFCIISQSNNSAESKSRREDCWWTTPAASKVDFLRIFLEGLHWILRLAEPSTSVTYMQIHLSDVLHSQQGASDLCDFFQGMHKIPLKHTLWGFPNQITSSLPPLSHRHDSNKSSTTLSLLHFYSTSPSALCKW